MKILLASVGVVVLASLAALALYGTSLPNGKDSVEQPRNGEQIQTPTEVEPELPADLRAHIESKSDLIVVDYPKPLQTITSPITVRGMARGTWFFEADFPLYLVNWDGLIIAQSHASAVLDPNDPESTWMTEDFVEFEGTLEFENPSFEQEFSQRGTIIFQRDNPSGLPENDDALEIPIMFEPPAPTGNGNGTIDGNGPRPCTLEAKICPDGSAVGRTGPNCEFAPCPGASKY